MSTNANDFFSTTTTVSARFALIGDKIIRLDEIQTVVQAMDETEEMPLSLVYYRNKEMDKVEISREDLFELLGTKIAA
jgi:hypothetical protein